MIDVCWVSRHLNRTDPYPVAARSYFDQGMLEALFAGELWRAPGQREFAHHVNFYDLESGRGAVVVVPARHHASADDVAWLNEQLRPLPWALVILTGDEEGVFPRADLVHPNMRIWVQTPKATDMAAAGLPGTFTAIGDGWPAACPVELAKTPPGKAVSWFFAGQITHLEREQCRDALQARIAERGDGYALLTRGFAQGLPAERYYAGLALAKIAPCPGGPETPDTFRVFEALEAGCIPVVARHPYWSLLLTPEHPLVQIGDWSEFSATADRLLAGWPANANRIGAWWMAYKRRVAVWLTICLDGFGAPQREVRPDDRITVLMPTSVIPSHPSTAIIEETIASVRDQLPDAEILVLVDGLPGHQEHRRADYDEYVRRLVWLCQRRWRNVLPILSHSHVHQSGLLARAMCEVATPAVLFVEHDTPLVGQIDWAGILAALDSGEAQAVRFHHEAQVHPEHVHLMLDTERRWVGPAGVPMLRTVQWSSRPHLATTALYRRMLADHFAPEARTFTEDVLHGVLESAWLDNGLTGWDRWRLWLYAPTEPGPMGGIKRSTHLDGRAGDVKEDCVFAYPTEAPPGAPQPTLSEVPA